MGVRRYRLNADLDRIDSTSGPGALGDQCPIAQVSLAYAGLK